MGAEIELAAGGESGYNYKSLLQQMAQREYAPRPLINSSTKKVRTTASVSRLRPKWAIPDISRPGAETKKKPNNVQPATP